MFITYTTRVFRVVKINDYDNYKNRLNNKLDTTTYSIIIYYNDLNRVLIAVKSII